MQTTTKISGVDKKIEINTNKAVYSALFCLQESVL